MRVLEVFEENEAQCTPFEGIRNPEKSFRAKIGDIHRACLLFYVWHGTDLEVRRLSTRIDIWGVP